MDSSCRDTSPVAVAVAVAAMVGGGRRCGWQAVSPDAVVCACFCPVRTMDNCVLRLQLRVEVDCWGTVVDQAAAAWRRKSRSYAPHLTSTPSPVELALAESEDGIAADCECRLPRYPGTWLSYQLGPKGCWKAVDRRGSRIMAGRPPQFAIHPWLALLTNLKLQQTISI